MTDLLSVPSYTPPGRARRGFADPIVRAWANQVLHEVRSKLARDNSTDTWHFQARAKMREISLEEVEALRFEGELHAIEIGSDSAGSKTLPKFVLQWTRPDGTLLEGVFATDGTCLRGITVYLVDASYPARLAA